MPSSSNMNSLVRESSYRLNGHARPHMQPHAASQTSLQKIPAPSPQFFYTNNSQSNQVMQFPPPPPQTMAPLVQQAATHVSKPSEVSINSFNPMIATQAQQPAPINIEHVTAMVHQQPNGINTGYVNNINQPPILMPPIMGNKIPQSNQSQHQSQPYMYPTHLQAATQLLPQSQSVTPKQAPPKTQSTSSNQMMGSQNSVVVTGHQQVPMTTIMIPASATAQLQNAVVQIQQAASQATAANQNQQPQILVFMIPYPVNQQPPQHPTVSQTPEMLSRNSTLVRHSQSSIVKAPQQQPAQSIEPTMSKAMTNLPDTKQESETFYIKANFSFQADRNKRELSFQKGEILHVLDVLQNNDAGQQYWLATRVKSNGKDADKGFIPHKGRAEEIAAEQRALDMGERGGTIDTASGSILSASVSRVNFLKRRSAQRSKSLCRDNWDNVVFDIGSIKLPVYERVVHKHPGFCRPVVIFGPLADVAREKLLKDYPQKYSYPTGFNQSIDHPRVIRLQGICEVIDQGKHALLDITPSAVEKLNFVNLAPIVIFMKTDSKSIIKEFRSRAAKSLDPNARDEDTLRRDGKSSRKLLEQSLKLEKMWSHIFTATLNLSTMGSEMWYRKLRETIENQQSANVWMSERKSDKNLVNQINNNNDMSFRMSNSHSTGGCLEDTTGLTDKFNENLNLSSKSTIDLMPNAIYGNRSQLRNAYAHSLAQKLARASSEPKLNGLMTDNDDDEIDDDDDDDEIVKKPFPAEFENSSSISSSNGATSYGHSSMTGSNLAYQHYVPPASQSDLGQNGRSQQPEAIYSRNPIMNSYASGPSSSSNYHQLPPMASDNGYHHNQSMNAMNNSIIDLSRNHEARGSAFQVYSDINQNAYHYYNINKI